MHVSALRVIAALVLAAGSSNRLGTPKQLLPIDGRPLVRHVVEAGVHAPSAVAVTARALRDLAPCVLEASVTTADVAELDLGVGHEETIAQRTKRTASFDITMRS